MPSSRNYDASAATWRSPRTISAPLMLSTELLPGTLLAATRRASFSHGTPRTPWTMSDDRPLKRTSPFWGRMTQAAGRTACRLSLSVCLDPLRCHLAPRTAALPVGPHRAAAGSLACTCRAECPATEHGLRQFPVPRLAAASKSPIRVPAATDSLSTMEALRLGSLAVHDDVTEEICTVPLSLADRVRTVDSAFSPRRRGIPRNVTADAGAVMARSLPQDCVNAWHVEFLTAVRRPY
ncbi:hypothetical protein C4B63_5g181 [Trypanosoma cruzi]|uniref:Uncharacterized protein n=1 Tax=Trypanosoma cruzi TaxID=5693 RepID=A0A2V2VXE3_TRYCR|nr:hypothetical protein C4B63_5g181 [Trypanosoma cruzi]